MGSLGSLRWLFVSTNELSGQIPAELNILSLDRLWLYQNDFTGCVPYSLTQTREYQADRRLPACTPSDRDVLVALYNATGGDNWTDNTNWLSNKPLDQWHGVTTDDTGRVTEIRLWNNGLDGQIPAEIGNLTNLEWLSLALNQLSGEIPAETGNLANLKILSLEANQLSGEIPAEIGNLANLEALYLRSNQLTGSIPAGDRQSRQPGNTVPSTTTG